MNDPVQVDPVGCGCTECLTGLYVPLNYATKAQVMLMLQGVLSDATGEVFTFTTEVSNYLHNPAEVHKVTFKARAEYSGLEWEW